MSCMNIFCRLIFKYISPMEEAYRDLYMEFLRLRSLCLKQAALLSRLMEMLKQQQAVSHIPNAGEEVKVSRPVQCMEEEHEYVGTRASPVTPQHPADLLLTSPVAGSCSGASYPLAEGLNRLHLQAAESLNIRPVEVHKIPTLGPLGAAGGNIAPTTVLADLMREEQRLRETPNKSGALANYAGEQEQKPPTQRRWMNSSFLNSEMLSQAGGLLMSEVALQSQVCEFCRAVFPGNTTTIGEFLRHLNTHVT
ncbi:uncharacterized protein zgc:113184 [Brienomyrus brachyistius]|uniref:uncharacterized protein zgc:113184 n=1 Tax=Brienomyrus brachyistius TaxID=42636 RepID=UPI0020B1F8DC|nr:uncharacterized protein zgc:113184 [Brienomyrus brachyistius]XP_048856342.1 uncharacterized protein zgc:113184 [Brienomyrus brachyistius]